MQHQQNEKPTDFFVMKNSKGAEFAFKEFLKALDFDDYKDGWQDKRGNEGVALLSSKKKDKKGGFVKVGTVICYDGSHRRTIEIIDEILGFGE